MDDPKKQFPQHSSNRAGSDESSTNVAAPPPSCKTYQQVHAASREKIMALWGQEKERILFSPEDDADDPALRNTLPCTYCEGQGTYSTPPMTVVRPGGVIATEGKWRTDACPDCRGVGRISLDGRMVQQTSMDMWCTCDQDLPEPDLSVPTILYEPDTHHACLRPRHYHCGKCGLICQVG